MWLLVFSTTEQYSDIKQNFEQYNYSFPLYREFSRFSMKVPPCVMMQRYENRESILLQVVLYLIQQNSIPLFDLL